MSKYGAACDNLLSAQVVTVDGRQVEASRELQSGSFLGNSRRRRKFRCRHGARVPAPSGNRCSGGNADCIRLGRIPELLQAFVKFVAAAPDEMNVAGGVLPSEQGTRFWMLVCYFGHPRHGNELLRPLRALKPQEDNVRVMSYLEAQAGAAFLRSACRAFPNGPVSSGTQRGRNCDDYGGNQQASPTNRVFIVPLYGAISRVGLSETAFALRQPGYELDILGTLERSGREGDCGAMGQVSARQFATPCAWSVRQPIGRNERRTCQGGVRVELRSPGGDQEKVRPQECAAAQPEHQAG